MSMALVPPCPVAAYSENFSCVKCPLCSFAVSAGFPRKRVAWPSWENRLRHHGWPLIEWEDATKKVIAIEFSPNFSLTSSCSSGYLTKIDEDAPSDDIQPLAGVEFSHVREPPASLFHDDCPFPR